MQPCLLWLSELRDPVDGEEHVHLALGPAQFTSVDVDIANRRLGKPTALGFGFIALWQARDAVPLQATMQGAARQCGNGLAQAAEHVVERHGTVRNFVRRLGMMGAKEPRYAATQRAAYFRRHP